MSSLWRHHLPHHPHKRGEVIIEFAILIPVIVLCIIFLGQALIYVKAINILQRQTNLIARGMVISVNQMHQPWQAAIQHTCTTTIAACIAPLPITPQIIEADMQLIRSLPHRTRLQYTVIYTPQSVLLSNHQTQAFLNIELITKATLPPWPGQLIYFHNPQTYTEKIATLIP